MTPGLAHNFDSHAQKMIKIISKDYSYENAYQECFRYISMVQTPFLRFGQAAN
jgi:hypothetical protein